jgi:hypothetical protein
VKSKKSMLVFHRFCYHQHDGIENIFTYFTTEYAERITLLPSTTKTELDLSGYTHIVGNDLYDLKHSFTNYAIIIDVMMLGLTRKTLDNLGLEAVVYAYNHYLVNHAFIRLDIPIDSFYVRDLPENVVEKKIPLTFSDGSRFNIINKSVAEAMKDVNFVGAIWPTCHYKAYKTPYLVLIYGKLDVQYAIEGKQTAKLI